jgi:hypothetical protein
VYAVGASIAVPLVPLFYVRVIGAPDAWIGIIGTTQALTLLIGYAIWRRQSRLRGSKFVLVWSTVGAALAPAALAMTRDVTVAAAIAGVGAIFTAGVNLAIFDRMMAIVPKGYGITSTWPGSPVRCWPRCWRIGWAWRTRSSSRPARRWSAPACSP